MPSSNIKPKIGQHQRPKSISPKTTQSVTGHRHHRSEPTLPSPPIVKDLSLVNGNQENGTRLYTSIQKEWSRSIPEAGYITLGTLRYGVRLSNGATRLSNTLSSCRNSDCVNTCTIPNHVKSSSLRLSTSPCKPPETRATRERRVRLKAESLDCGKCCCVGLSSSSPTTANGRCCEVSLCFSGSLNTSTSSMEPAGAPSLRKNSLQDDRHEIHQRQRSRPQTSVEAGIYLQSQRQQNPSLSPASSDATGTPNSAVTQLRFPKNRIPTLSPTQPSSSAGKSTRTSWCSSSPSAVSPNSSRSVSSEVHPLTLLRVNNQSHNQTDHHIRSHSQIHLPVSDHRFRKPQDEGSPSNESVAAHQRPPLSKNSASRTVSSNWSESLSTQDSIPATRSRTLSTDEEFQSIGCFNLKQSLSATVSHNNNKHNSKCDLSHDKFTAVSALNHKKSAEKPNWLQVCDPCYRIIERSVTPDNKDLQIRSNDNRCRAFPGESRRKTIANVPIHPDRTRSQEVGGAVDDTTLFDSELAELRFIDSSVIDLDNWVESRPHQDDNNKASLRECELSNGPIQNGKEVGVVVAREAIGVDSSRRHRQERSREEWGRAWNGDSANNNNLGERHPPKERKRMVVSSESRSTNSSDHRGCLISSVVAKKQATSSSSPELSFQSQAQWSPTQYRGGGIDGEQQGVRASVPNEAGDLRLRVKADEKNNQEKCLRDCFEEDYEKCIQSINRQLELECRDARRRRTSLADNQDKLNRQGQSAELEGHHPEEAEDQPAGALTMEKRRNTFERFQKWGFGQRSASNNDLASSQSATNPGEAKPKDKSERLKELTELLKGTKIPSLAGFHRNTYRETSRSPPPVPPPRRQRSGASAEKSFEKLEPIEDNEEAIGGRTVTDAIAKAGRGPLERKISVPTMKINDPNSFSSPGQEVSSSSTVARPAKPLHLSISSPHFRSLLEKSQPPHTTDCNDGPAHADELFSLPKVEPKTIMGSYAQKNIPYRSASFSQVDFSSGKYSLGGGSAAGGCSSSGGSVDRELLNENRNSTSVLESSTYPRRRGDLRLLRKMKLSSPGPRAEHDISIAEETSPSPEHETRRMSFLETIESVSEDVPVVCEPLEGSDVEKSIGKVESVEEKGKNDGIEIVKVDIMENLEEVPRNASDIPVGEECDGAVAAIKDVPASLESELMKSGTELEKMPEYEKSYQSACEIPTPVFECCGKEVETVTEWFQLKEDSPDGLEIRKVCKDCPDSVLENEKQNSPVGPMSDVVPLAITDPCHVEVRKRNTFSSDSGNSKQSSLEKNDDSPLDERKKIDKSKRRKGIYIQWPVAGKGPDESWDIDSPDCDIIPPSVGGGPLPLKLNVNLRLNYDCLSTASCDPLTPDSDNIMQSQPWPRAPVNPDSTRKKSLTYQSSEEKEERPLREKSKKSNLVQMDSTSDNESDRAMSRDPRSVSPSKDDLKRYSKRPLRGPYGQMLEAEMKKASKVHYDEILDDLRSSSELKTSPRSGRSNVSHSLDESAKYASSISPKPRKTSAHLPIPFHSRAASTPSQMDHLQIDDGLGLPAVKKKFPNSVDKLYSEAAFVESGVISNVSSSPATSPINNKQCKRTASAIMDRSSRKKGGSYSSVGGADPISKASSSLRKHNSELVETPRGPIPGHDLLAELLRGSSEKYQCHSVSGKRTPGTVSPSQNLPQAVQKCLDTRTHVVIELFNTEQSYVESLQTVIVKYLNPLKSSDHLRDIVDSQLVDEIFYMVPSILGIHERFLEELHKRLGAWDVHQRVGDAFIDVFSSSSVVEIYSSFVNNWNKAKNAIRQASAAKPAFARFLESMSREHKGKLSLDNLLIKPVQKFPNYELILSRLIKHTDGEHPDQNLLQEANKLVHNILVQLNCKEKEAIENGQREAILRELETVIEGVTDLVSGERTFLLFDLVSMFSGHTTRKERGLFLFSDILVVASIKKRTGTIKKPATSLVSGVAATLDTNKYKFLMKMRLVDLDIAKSKDESVRKMMREIEHLSEDNVKIQKLIDIMNSIRFPHEVQEESIRDLQRDVQKQLIERQANDTQLSILEFSLISNDIHQNMSIVFSKPDKRNQWEEAFSQTKQKLATSFEKRAAPEFLSMIPIRKTRAGLQFTCAASTIGSMKDVWVCNSDGYVGQVCVLSLFPEPTVISCNGVCNARILCVTSVPPQESMTIDRSASGSCESTLRGGCVPGNDKGPRRAGGGCRSQSTTDNGLQLDSSSSSDNESDIEFSGQLNSSSMSPRSVDDVKRERSPVPNNATGSISSVASGPSAGGGSGGKSDGEDMDRTQSTMWLGTEDGCVHVYNCTDNIRIKKNKIKIQHSSAVYSILYLDNRVFVSLANGDICVYLRDNAGWNTNSPITMSVGAITSPVTKLLNVHGKIWCSIQGAIKVLNVQQLQIESQIQISTESKPITNIVASTNCVWVAIQNSSVIKCYHSTSHELLFEIDVSNPVNKMLSTCDDIIRQHKSACLRITSLLACNDLLWIGTSAGVLLNLPVSNSTKGLQHIVSSISGISYGHTGHVRFLTSVELNISGQSKTKSLSTDPTALGGNSRKSPGTRTQLKTLIISGGDGYEDFRSSSANSGNDVAGREDSTNHLLLWQI